VLVHAAVRMHVWMRVPPVLMRMLACVDVRVGVDASVGVPVLVSVRLLPFDPGLAFAAAAGRAHGLVL